MRRVVVTGIGALTPIGIGQDAFLAGLQAGMSGACPISYFDASLFRTRFACQLKDFNVENFLDKRKPERLTHFLNMP